MYHYGLDIGGTKIELRAYDSEMQEAFSSRTPTPTISYDAFIETVVTLILTTDVHLNTKGHIGIGIPGSESVASQRIFAPNIPAIDRQSIRADLESKLQRKIHIANDATCFAISESRNDLLTKNKRVIGLILGTGFGAGLSISQQGYLGANGMAMEVGHTPISFNVYERLNRDNNLPLFVCECGRKGCLDRYLSGTGFEALYAHDYGELLSAKAIVSQYLDNVPNAVSFVDKYVDVLALSISSYVNVFDPDAIVLGGGLSNFDEMYRLINERLPSMSLSRDVFPIVSKARFGDSSGVRGAAMLTLGDDAN